MLFFLPIVVMSIAYALIIGRLWGSKPPGEKMDAALSNQARAKRKVSIRQLVIPIRKKSEKKQFISNRILVLFFRLSVTRNSTQYK